MAGPRRGHSGASNPTKSGQGEPGANQRSRELWGISPRGGFDPKGLGEQKGCWAHRGLWPKGGAPPGKSPDNARGECGCPIRGKNPWWRQPKIWKGDPQKGTPPRIGGKKENAPLSGFGNPHWGPGKKWGRGKTRGSPGGEIRGAPIGGGTPKGVCEKVRPPEECAPAGKSPREKRELGGSLSRKTRLVQIKHRGTSQKKVWLATRHKTTSPAPSFARCFVRTDKRK